jgi:hypothetical protein
VFCIILQLSLLFSYADVDWMDAVGWTARLYDEIQISTLRNPVGYSNTDLNLWFVCLLLQGFELNLACSL